MKKFGIQIKRINKIQSSLPISIDKTFYFKSIFQSPFMSTTFLILHRDSVFLLIYLMQCLGIYSIIIPLFTGKYFSNFNRKPYYVNRKSFHFIRRSKPCYVQKFASARHGV